MHPPQWTPSEEALALASLPGANKLKASLRVPWLELELARSLYLDWHVFISWVYGILEIERSVPEWLNEVLNDQAPGMLEIMSPDSPRYNKRRRTTLITIWQELSQWVRQNIFSDAVREGWLEAIHRPFDDDLIYTRLAAYADYCRERWQRRRPVLYPSLNEWRKAAENCSRKILDSFPISDERRQLLAASRRVTAKQLSTTVDAYIGWHDFTYWTRSAFRLVGGLPPNVITELKGRCPGFLERDAIFQKTVKPSQYDLRWLRLVEWIHDHVFATARRERWLNLLVFSIRLRARAERTMLYWVDWDREWSPSSTLQYPVFEEWRGSADSYVRSPHADHS